MARSLKELGYPAETVIAMVRGDQIALRSTVGQASALTVTTSKYGTPVVARYRKKGKSRPQKCTEDPGLVPSASKAKDEPKA
jgi:hypothetical protein